MKFDLMSPCSECPYRADIRPYLEVERVADLIRDVIFGDKTFACHKTTGIVNGKRVRRADHQSCAGAMILAKREGWRNAMFQIADRLGLLDSERLDMEASVFLSAAAMLSATEYEECALTVGRKVPILQRKKKPVGNQGARKV